MFFLHELIYDLILSQDVILCTHCGLYVGYATSHKQNPALLIARNKRSVHAALPPLAFRNVFSHIETRIIVVCAERKYAMVHYTRGL